MARLEATTAEEYLKTIQSMPIEQLMAQQLVQQGAIHAISTLLANGCKQYTAEDMLVSLRDCADMLREEFKRRGEPPGFKQDQTAFH